MQSGAARVFSALKRKPFCVLTGEDAHGVTTSNPSRMLLGERARWTKVWNAVESKQEQEDHADIAKAFKELGWGAQGISL